MGNCCGKETPCQHTKDEKKGLLHSCESNTSTKAGTESGISPISDEGKGFEDTKPELEETVVNQQPNAESQTPKAKSSYSTTIAVLHTDVSLASKEIHNVSLTEAPTEAGCSAVETKTEVQEVQNNAVEVTEILRDKVEVSAEASALPAKLEIKDWRGSLENQTVNTGVVAASQDSTFAPVKEAPVEETPVKEALVEETPVKEALVKEEPVKLTPVKEAPFKLTPVKEAPFKEDPTEETPAKEETSVKEAPVEETPVYVHVEAEEKPSELKPETHVSDEKKTLQTGELLLNATTDVKHEENGLALHDTGDVSVIDNSTEPDSHISGQSNDLDVTEKSVTKVAGEECIMEKKVEEKHLEDTCTEMAELQQEISEAKEYLQQVSSPVVDIANGFSPGVQNGLMKDSNSLNIENETNSVTVMEQLTHKDNTVQKPCGEPLEIESEEPSSKPSTYIDSTFEMDIPDVKNSVTNHEEQQATEPTRNGLHSPSVSSPIEKTSEFVVREIAAMIEDKLLTSQDGAEPEPQQGDEETEKKTEKREKPEEEQQEEEAGVSQAKEEKEVTENSENQKGGIIFISDKVDGQLISVPSEGSVEEVQNLDESTDLYLGPEETEMGASKDKPSKPVLELTIPGVDKSSLAPAVDILAYSEREWKGNTAKSALIRKGYSEMSHSFSALKQVRGDNYCALRATMYQVLVTSTQTPTWLQDEGFLLLPEVIEAREHLIGGWAFPPACTWGCEKENSVERLKYYLDLFKTKWQAAAACESPEERQSLCERLFQGGEEEYGLLEALKFLMLAKAVELHVNMMADQEVPVFCWLLFARDTSENPQTLLANHLSQIGFSGGVEQVEMFLLGYALQHTIQAFRLYMTDTDEFVTHYPDDHKQEWPCVCIVTEDDRHYNVPVRRTTQHQQKNNITTA